MLPTIALITAGFAVKEVLAFFRRPSFADTAVSAVAGLAIGLVCDPFSWEFFTPTVGGLVAATLLAFWGGVLFFLAHSIGHRQSNK